MIPRSTTAGPSVGNRLLAHYQTMARIRAFERKVAKHFRDGDVHGFVHTSIGQEAVAAGGCASLERGDVLFTTHRGHGHCLAKGANPTAMMAELFGRATGSCRGKGGSMHLAAPGVGVLGANGIVGAGIPLAVGAGLTARSRGTGNVSVVFFGEGAVHTGAFHEGLNLAAVWHLPVVFICENNHYAEFTQTEHWGGPAPADRATSYGITAHTVDGNDVLAVEDVVHAARAGALSHGPVFVEAVTYRMSGHYEGDPIKYREKNEQAAWQERDPLALVATRLRGRGWGDRVDAADRAAQEEMDQVVTDALAAPYPPVSALLEDVHA